MGEAEQIWRSKSDDEVLEASHALADYTEEGERIIRAELRQWGLSEPPPPIGACPRCGRSVNNDHPGAACTQCGERLPEQVIRELERVELTEGNGREPEGPTEECCPRCGSSTLIPDVGLIDHFGEAGDVTSTTEGKVHGNPIAWVLGGSVTGKLSVEICAECGHAELRADNFRELYKAFRQARQE